MAKKNTTRGFYLFEDGTYCWFNGLSGAEKRNEIRKHGKIIRFEPTAWTGKNLKEISKKGLTSPGIGVIIR